MISHKRLVFLLTLILCIPLCAEEDQDPQESPPVVNTIHQITDTAKGLVGSVGDKAKKISTRAKEEGSYFVQEIRSFFRTPQQILLKQNPEQVAQEHEAIVITVTLDKADYTAWSPLVDCCNTESVKSAQEWYVLLESIYLTLRKALTEKSNVTIAGNFLPQLPVSTFLVSHLDNNLEQQAIKISVILHAPENMYEWIEPVQQSMQFLHDVSQTADPYHQLDSFYTIVMMAIQKNLLKTICIESSN